MPSSQPAGADTMRNDGSSMEDLKIKKLFNRWVNTVEEEVLTLLKEKGEVDIQDIATNLKLPEDTVLLFIQKMGDESKIKIKTVAIG
jgi:predicted transcriptional regulator